MKKGDIVTHKFGHKTKGEVIAVGRRPTMLNLVRVKWSDIEMMPKGETYTSWEWKDSLTVIKS